MSSAVIRISASDGCLTGESFWKREGPGLPNFGEATRAQIGQQRSGEDLIAIVEIFRAQRPLLSGGGDYHAGDQAVGSKAVEDGVQRAFQEKVRAFDEDPVYLARGKGGE